MSIIQKINDQLEEFKVKKETLKKELQKEFPQLLKPLFEKSKKIESIGWRQYTPYFNDGDECVFQFNGDDLIINGEDEADSEFLDWRMKYVLKGEEKCKKELEGNSKLDYDEYAIVQDFKTVLASIPNEFYKDLFGDHVTVTVNKDGTIETEEYDHD